jgi:hypothetical protein
MKPSRAKIVPAGAAVAAVTAAGVGAAAVAAADMVGAAVATAVVAVEVAAAVVVEAVAGAEAAVDTNHALKQRGAAKGPSFACWFWGKSVDNILHALRESQGCSARGSVVPEVQSPTQKPV